MMKASADKTPKSEKPISATTLAGSTGFIDARPAQAAQRQLMETMNQSPQHQAGLAMAKMIRQGTAPLDSPRGALQCKLLSQPLKTTSIPDTTAQLAWTSRNYSLNDSQRRLHVDHHNVNWGATDPGNWPDRANQRGIIYETIATMARVGASIGRFAGIEGNQHDVGLSLVLNAPYVHATDNKIRANNGHAVNAPVAPENSEAQVKTDLNAARTEALNAWNGPPINISTLAWERKYAAGEGNNLESVRPAVPFASLRKEAGSNPNANAIEQQLKVTRDGGAVWHKMGDDDMTYHNPNGGGEQMTKLGQVEGTFAASNIVTFGYNLTTNGAPEDVRNILSTLYYREMELRNRISERAKTYPIEPNTYYKFENEDQQQAAWNATEDRDVGGGGGQIKEGLKFMGAMQDTVGVGDYLARRDAFHTVMENTDSGGRNDALVNVLNPLLEQAQLGNRPEEGAKGLLRTAITGMDQSYFDRGVWQQVARQLMGGLNVHAIQDAMNGLVDTAVTEAVDEIFNRINNIVTLAEIRMANRSIWDKGLNKTK